MAETFERSDGVCGLKTLTSLSAKTFVEHLHAEARHALRAIWSIGVGAHLVFNCKHGNPVQERPQDAGQRARINVYDLSFFLTPLHYLPVGHKNVF